MTWNLKYHEYMNQCTEFFNLGPKMLFSLVGCANSVLIVVSAGGGS